MMAANCCGVPVQQAKMGAPLLLVLIPKFGCPLCWPLLSAALGTCGLSIGTMNGVFLGIAGASLVMAALCWLLSPTNRQHWALLGVFSTVALLGRFVPHHSVEAAAVVAGIVVGVLAGRSAWERKVRLEGGRGTSLAGQN